MNHNEALRLTYEIVRGEKVEPTGRFCNETGCLEPTVDGTFCVLHSPAFNEAVNEWEIMKRELDPEAPEDHDEDIKDFEDRMGILETQALEKQYEEKHGW